MEEFYIVYSKSDDNTIIHASTSDASGIDDLRKSVVRSEISDYKSYFGPIDISSLKNILSTTKIKKIRLGEIEDLEL